MLSRRTMSGPVAGRFQMPVCVVRPFQGTSCGIPTFTAISVAMCASPVGWTPPGYASTPSRDGNSRRRGDAGSLRCTPARPGAVDPCLALCLGAARDIGQVQALLVRRVEDVLVGTVTAAAACRSGGLTAFVPGHARRREVVAQVRAEMHGAGRYDLIRARPVVTPRQPAWL